MAENPCPDGTLERVAGRLEQAARERDVDMYVVWTETASRARTHEGSGPCGDYELGAGAFFDNPEDAAWSLLAAGPVTCEPDLWRHMAFPVAKVTDRGFVDADSSAELEEPRLISRPDVVPEDEEDQRAEVEAPSNAVWFGWDPSESSNCELREEAQKPKYLNLLNFNVPRGDS
jgi:hypothetical protein